MKILFPISTLGLLAACTVGPDYKGPPAAASQAQTRGSFLRADDPALRPAPGIARWWEGLGDTTLTALIDDALAHSPNIDAAEARIREARSQLRQQQSALLPSLSANATYLHAELPGVDIGNAGTGAGGGASASSTSLNFYNLGGNASWEPDLFGGTRRGVEAARATIGQRYADLADAQVSLSAQVAQAYVNLRDAQERSRLNDQSVALQRRQLSLAQQRYERGSAAELDLQRLRNELDTTEAQNISLLAEQQDYLNQLAVLTGREPGALDRTLSTLVAIPLPPAAVPIGDPAGLIARRPDVRSAERALAASSAQIGVNKAKLFPSIRFMGILGLGGTRPGDVVDTGNLSTFIAPMLSWNILDFGRVRATVSQAEAQRDEADAQYRQKVLEALQDAETSLARFGSARRQFGKLMTAEQAAARSAQLNQLRVEAGASSVSDQIDIERQHLSSAMSTSQAKAQLTNSYIAVQKALGLGWAEASQ